MAPIHRSHTTVLGLAALLSIGLLALITTPARDDPVAAAPGGHAWAQTSGNDSVETPRPITALRVEPTIFPLPMPMEVRSEPARSSPRTPSVASIRLAVAQQAFLSDDRESLAEAAAFARYWRGEHSAVEPSALPIEARAGIP
jgi:hypothetical protein